MRMRDFLTVLVVLLGFAQSVDGATPVATYQFANSFAADESGPPDIVALDPLGTSFFSNDVVFGVPRPVWNFDGNAFPTTEQAGLRLDTTGLISPSSYSVDLVFLFTEGQDAWRRILDVEDRQSDSGFYVDPSNNLAIFPVSGSAVAWTNDEYQHVVLTNDGTTVAAYLEGVAEFTAATTVMNINNVNNPNDFLTFFADNVLGGGQGEFSDGRVALVRVWDGVLSPEEARVLSTNPFVPEPSSYVLATLGLAGLALARRKHLRRS